MSTEDKDSKVPVIQLKDIKGNSVPATTTLEVAEFTGKEHKHIIRDLETLISEGYISESNFGLSTYQGARRAEKMYVIDEEATSLLLMSYSGKASMEWKKAYIDEFKRMRSALSDTNYIRKKGDEFALADKMQKMALLNERRRVGKLVETDHFALMNISKTTNRLAFGTHEKNMRQNMKQSDALKLSKSLELTYREILSGNIEVKGIEQTVKPLMAEETKKLK